MAVVCLGVWQKWMVVGLEIMEVWKDSGFGMKIGRKSTIQFEIYAQNYKVKEGLM